MKTSRIVIVGSGVGGYSVAQALRKRDGAVDLVLVTGEAGAGYSKPLLSNAIAQKRSAAQWITSPPEAMASRLNLTLKSREPVTAIDVANRCVDTSGGRYGYDALVLATGAEPARPPIAGDRAREALAVNDLDDYARFRAAIEGARRVLVIGAGLIGCEFANDLLGANVVPFVVDPGPRPLASLAPAGTGLALQRALEAGGVQWRLGRTVRSIQAAGTGYAATLDDGEVLRVDAVLCATGLRPRTRLARDAGLHVNRGIVVDDYGRASRPGILAVGDCAEYPDGVHPFVRPVLIAAKAMAATLLGTPTRIAFPPMPVSVKTPLYPVTVLPPPADTAGDWTPLAEAGSDGFVFRDSRGAVRGFSLGGASAASRAQALLGQIDTPATTPGPATAP
ncbi:FAD-dependent oxidoreductase [Burkholderia sp. WAC0059]|uniref:NAD(P)/FAD-dependent oxidoreductase n=1 Tax=Burkholderia sp. WAC0059 TaxID=2066022 RepID=UPI000C7EEC21|nr:FAD-dependent oxidoreductase [Burkholderia sp. WAC0059]PLZ03097.1 FAD-dependent oxidoreductase [Burkholderia sp. WAC0059]